MTQNRALKVFVAAGYYDFATPFFAAEYTFDHLRLDPALAQEHHARALRRRPHDVHPQAVAREADGGRRGVLSGAARRRREVVAADELAAADGRLRTDYPIVRDRWRD